MNYLTSVYETIKFNRFINMKLKDQKLNKKKLMADRKSGDITN